MGKRESMTFQEFIASTRYEFAPNSLTLELMQKAFEAGQAAAPQFPDAALLAAEQCMVDFLEVWQRRASQIVIQQAVYSIKDDGLPAVRKALKAARARAQAREPKQ